MSAALPIRAGQASNALPTLGFEGGQQGGQSYGLDEVSRIIRKRCEGVSADIRFLKRQLVQRDPPFTVGRVQVGHSSSTSMGIADKTDAVAAVPADLVHPSAGMRF